MQTYASQHDYDFGANLAGALERSSRRQERRESERLDSESLFWTKFAAGEFANGCSWGMGGQHNPKYGPNDPRPFVAHEPEQDPVSVEHPPSVESLRKHAHMVKRGTVEKTRAQALRFDAEARKDFEGDSLEERIIRLCRDGMLFTVVGRTYRVSKLRVVATLREAGFEVRRGAVSLPRAA